MFVFPIARRGEMLKKWPWLLFQAVAIPTYCCCLWRRRKKMWPTVHRERFQAAPLRLNVFSLQRADRWRVDGLKFLCRGLEKRDLAAPRCCSQEDRQTRALTHTHTRVHSQGYQRNNLWLRVFKEGWPCCLEDNIFVSNAVCCASRRK